MLAQQTVAICLIAGATLLGVSSCESQKPASRPTSVPADYSLDASIRNARDDFRAGRAKIFLAGSIAVSEAGVRDADRPLVADLPRCSDLPEGCTTEGAAEAAIYAENYNQMIIKLRREQRSTTAPSTKPA